MAGPEIFQFTMESIPKLISDTLIKSKLNHEDIDHFVFHQANGFMLEHLRKKLKIPPEKFPIEMKDCGNTVSSTVPIVLERLRSRGALKTGDKVLAAGFGVGYSWGACIVFC